MTLLTDSDKALVELWTQRGFVYHVNYLISCRNAVGIAGKHVLEVGGALPGELVLKEFGAASWTAIEEPSYYAEEDLPALLPGVQPEPMSSGPAQPGGYRYIHSAIEKLTTDFDSRFDLVFSIAAFEHFSRLPLALDCMYKSLKPGGKLFTLFAPIWPSVKGHHLPGYFAFQGERVECPPCGPWEHLLYSPSELFIKMSERCSSAIASEVVRLVHHAPRINRLFVEDYVRYATSSKFTVEELMGVYRTPITPEVEKILQARFPGRKDFSSQGILMVLGRPE